MSLEALSVPRSINGPLSAEDLKNYFNPRSDLTYRTLFDLTVQDADLYQSLFTGSLIRQCQFKRVRFARSDLDGVRIESAVFDECDFSNCDIRSSVFVKCEFRDCRLAVSLIDDCEFKDCRFLSCIFTNAVIRRCRFRSSELSSCDLSPGSFLNNKLYESKIVDMVLGNCTLLYLITRGCQFNSVSINAESIGAIFGLTREQLSAMEMVYLGQDQPIPQDEEVVALVADEYRKRRWHIGQLALSLNFGLTSTLDAFDYYLSESFSKSIQIGFAKGDELEFLGDVVEELAALGQLPLLVPLNILEWCSELETRLSSQDADNQSLRTLASRISLLTNSLIHKLERSTEALEIEADRTLCVRAEFEEKPTIGFADLLNAIASASKLPIGQESKFVTASSGSYLEIVYTTLSTLFALKVFLYLVNGCLIQLTEMKHRAKVLARRNIPPGYRESVLTPIQPASTSLITAIQSLTAFTTNAAPLLKAATVAGFGNSNFKGLQEVDCEDAVSPRRR